MLNFSIIVTVYNKEDTLKRCIKSIIQDITDDYEVIIVDDGSTDNSYNIANTFSKKDKRIKIYKQENKGIGYSRKKSIEWTKGRYLLFVDADDYIDSNLLNVLRLKIIEYDYPDIIRYNLNEINNTKNKSRFLVNNTELINGIEALYKWNSNTSTRYGIFTMYTFKTDFIKNHLEEFLEIKCYEDVATITKLLFYADKLLVLNYMGYYYYRNNSSITLNGKIEKLYWFKLAIEDILKFYKDKLGTKNELYKIIKSYYDYHLNRKKKFEYS